MQYIRNTIFCSLILVLSLNGSDAGKKIEQNALATPLAEKSPAKVILNVKFDYREKILSFPIEITKASEIESAIAGEVNRYFNTKAFLAMHINIFPWSYWSHIGPDKIMLEKFFLDPKSVTFNPKKDCVTARLLSKEGNYQTFPYESTIIPHHFHQAVAHDENH